MTSNADSKCYTKFDRLMKNVEPIKFHVPLIFIQFDITIIKEPLPHLRCRYRIFSLFLSTRGGRLSLRVISQLI